jgi:hypothetical protein
MYIDLDFIFTLLILAIGVLYVAIISLIITETKFYKNLSDKPGCQISDKNPAVKTLSKKKSDAKRLRAEQRCAAPWD